MSLVPINIKNYLKISILFIVFCFNSQYSISQSTGTQSPVNPAATSTQQDTFNAEDSVIVRNAFFKLFKGKPGRATLYSLILPGGGQLYNKKYWKVPVAWAIDGALGYYLWSQNTQYRASNKLFMDALASGNTQLANTYREDRNDFRRAKEFAWMYLILGHLLTTIDAYVDRHLMEFDISPDISYAPYTTTPSIGLSLMIPLGQRK